MDIFEVEPLEWVREDAEVAELAFPKFPLPLEDKKKEEAKTEVAEIDDEDSDSD